MAIQSPSHASPWTFWRVVWATLVLVALGLSFWLLYRFHQVLFILFIAIIMGTVLRPPVSWLQRRGIPGVAGVILVYLLLLALLIGFALLLVPVIVEQTTTLAVAVPDSYQSLRDWIVGHPNPLITQFSRFLPATLSLLDPGQSTGQEMLDTAGQALGYLGSASKGVFTGAAILLLAFYWTLDGPRTVRSLLLVAPVSKREGVRELITAMETKVGAYVAGQSLLSLIVGLLALIAYLIIGLPYALVLTLVAGVMEAVPLVGPLLGAIPAALVALTLGPDKVVWVVVATVVIQQLESSLLVPRVMRQAVGVSPFVSLLALFAFSSLLGIAGALMAIPMAAIIQILLNRFVFERGAMEPELSGGRDLGSRLRYEAHDLARDLRHQARRTRAGSDRTIRQTDLVLDEIETLATDLDTLLAETNGTGVE
ncbi:MAG TPA: AI-2E family transporter [Candidatus Sulfomarinibacteraceae bacterium]|nr:AI-2E family transporter [Candidatus Sulfomarinibacteraceae bacterium]